MLDNRFIIILLLWSLSACSSASTTPTPVTVQPTAATSASVAQASLPQPPTNLTPVPLAVGERLRVVASTTIIGDWTAQVGGDLIDLAVLMPVGADPHTYKPTPQDLTTVAQAHLLLINGLELEATLEESLANAGGSAPMVPIAFGIPLRQLDPALAAEENAAGDHHHGTEDPHVWTSPYLAITLVQNIATLLSELDPPHAAAYQANAQQYTQQLTELDQWVQQQIDTIPVGRRQLVTDHAVFGYYADRYGLTQVGAVIPGFSTGAEPSAQELAALEDTIRNLQVPALFVGATVNPKLSEQIAQDTGIKVLQVYTGSLGPPGSGAASYLDYIRYNTNAFVTGLK